MNPLSAFRFASNLVIVAVIAAFLYRLLIVGPPVGNGWLWIIGGVAFGAGALQTLLALALPRAAETACDELNRAADRMSCVWGYWATLAVCLVLLVLILSDRVQPMLAFGLASAPLAAGPPLYMLLAHLRGRAG